MCRLLFIARISLKEMLKHKFTLVISTISMMLGLLITCLMLGIINSAFSQVETTKATNMNNTIVYDFYSKPISLDSIEDYENNIGSSAIISSEIVPIHYGKSNQQSSVVSVSERYFKNFTSVELVEGELIKAQEFKDKLPVCLVEENFIIENGDVLIGDKIQIYGKEFRIIGIIKLFSQRENIFIPYGINIGNQGSAQTMYIQYHLLPDIMETQTMLEKQVPQDEGYPVEPIIATFSDVYKKSYIENITNSILILLVAGILIIYAAINVTLVLLGKMRLNQYTIGVKIALGAKKRDIFLGILLENIVVTFLATLALIPLVPIFKKSMPSGIGFQIGGGIYIITFIIGVVVSSVITVILIKKLAGNQVQKLIGGRC